MLILYDRSLSLKTAEDCSSSTTLLSSAQLGKSKALGCWNEMLIEWNIVISLVKHRILGAETAQDFGWNHQIIDPWLGPKESSKSWNWVLQFCKYLSEYSTPKVDEVLVIGVKQHFNNIWWHLLDPIFGSWIFEIDPFMLLEILKLRMRNLEIEDEILGFYQLILENIFQDIWCDISQKHSF